MTDDLNALADRIEAVLAGLTEAQRELIVTAPMLADGRVLIPHMPFLVRSAPGLCRYYSADRDALRPLGVAVRARLIAQQEGQR